MTGARYGQHFLINRHAVERIAAALDPSPEDRVLEIGPGKGALTEQLAARAGALVAVEIDVKLAEALRGKYRSRPAVRIVEEDILAFSFDSLTADATSAGGWKVAGNLPYNLTSPILRRLADWTGWTVAVVMVQKEVGDRLCAVPGTAEYGALTVGMNLTCRMEPVFDLSPTSFSPPPRVMSSVIKIFRRPSPLTSDVPGAQRVIQAAFQQRRKTILNSVAHGLGVPKEAAGKIVMEAGIDPGVRPERIPVDGFIALAAAVANAVPARPAPPNSL